MGVKYILQYKAIDGVAWQCDIETSSYSDVPIVIHGVSEQACELDYAGDTADNAFNPLIKSTLTVNLYNEGQVDVDELLGSADKDFVAKLFRNGQLFWAGYIQPEQLSRKLTTPPYDFVLTFVCGLTLLDTVPYTHKDLPGLDININRCPMNYIRQILFDPANLGIVLPIRWTNKLVCTAFNDDFFTGSVRWSPFNEDIYTYQQGVTGEQQGPAQTCGYILSGILQACQCRIYQSNGKWYIRRVLDILVPSIPFKEIPGTLGIMVIQSGFESLAKRIGRGGYRFINENGVLTVVQGLKSFKTTYTAAVRTNILPNGNFDNQKYMIAVADVLGGTIFLYWGSFAGNPAVVDRDSLDGRSGYSANLSNLSGDGYFTMCTPGGVLGKNGLPLDSYTLLQGINFSFEFSPGTDFAPVDGADQIIWDSNPLQFKMILNYGLIQYFLNEFGYWSLTEAWVPVVIPNMKIGDIAQVNFDKFQGIKLPEPPTQPMAGDTCDLQIIFRTQSDQTYALDNVSITITNANDVYEVFNDDSKNTSTDNISLNISSSFNGYMLSNFMSSPFNAGDESKFNDGAVYSGTLTGVNSQAMMRFRHKSSQIMNTDMSTEGANWSFDEIYSADSLLGKKFLPLNAKYYTEKCICNIIAMEARNDNITLRESFYSSNDTLNSN